MRPGSFVPEGHPRVARRFNAGEARKGTLVPKGRPRILFAFGRPFGTDLLFGFAHPALKRRAILGSPFGAKRRRELTDSFNPTPRGWIQSLAALLVVGFLAVSCGDKGTPGAADPHLSTDGTIEVTARLLEIPPGAIFKRDLYDYATILKYRVLKVHRGQVREETIYVGHYNPWKPRSEAADARVKNIGGKLRRFAAGQVHHLALEAPIEDCFMGGIVNKYFGQATGTLYWAVWTDPQGE